MAKLTTRNTKNEILDAYNDLVKQLELTKKNKVDKVDQTSASTKQAKNIPNTETTSKPIIDQPISVKDVIKNLQGLQSQFSESANVLQQKLSTEALHLQALHNEVASYTQHLQTLHNIEVNDDSLQQLMNKYELTAEKQQKELETAQNEIVENITQKQKQWQKEQQEYNEIIKEKDQEQKKQRQREIQEYKYNLEQLQKKDKDEFEQQQKIQDNELKALLEQAQQDWQEKEDTLAKQEKEAQELTDKAKHLEEELEKAIKKAEEEGKAIATHQSQNQANLLTKDHDGKKRVFELKINALETTIQQQNNQIKELSEQLSIASQQAQDLAVKALEGNTNANSFEAIKEIALEQAKNTTKAK